MDGVWTNNSLVEFKPEIRLEESSEVVNFDEVDGVKTVGEVANKTGIREEKIKASREYVERYVNEPFHLIAKGTQGGGKSKAVLVAVYYLIKHGEVSNFVYSAESYEQKLNEVWEDVAGEGKVYDPFTGKEIEFGSEVKTKFLKGLDKLMEEEREARGLPEDEPLGIFVDRQTEEETEFSKYCEHVGRKEALKYAEWPEDDFEVLEDWRNRKEKVRNLAKTNTPLIVVTPNAMRERMSVFSKLDWEIFGDEVSEDSREPVLFDLDGGDIETLKNGELWRDETNHELIEQAGRLVHALEMILEGAKDFSWNDRPEKEIVDEESKAWRKRKDGELYISRKIDLFDGGAFGWDDGVDESMLRMIVDSLYAPGRYWRSGHDDNTPLKQLIEDEVEALLEEGELEQAGRVNELRWVWNKIKELEKYGVWLNERHKRGSKEIHKGIVPSDESEKSLLMTYKHEMDSLFDQGFKSGNRLRILSASAEEEWFRRKLDRYERANNFREDLNDYFEYVAPKLEENFTIDVVERWQKTTWAQGQRKDEYAEFSDLLRPYVEGDEDRHAIMPKQMKKEGKWSDDSVNCWNSDVMGSNDAEGKKELLLCYTYSPPTDEIVLTYVDLEGEYPPLVCKNGRPQIPEEYVEKSESGRQRIGLKDDSVDIESSLSIAYKSLVETHINDALRRLREHHIPEKNVKLMTQKTEEIRRIDDSRVNTIRFWELLGEIIVELKDDELEDFVGQTITDLIKWVKENGFDIGDTPADKVAGEIGKRMNWAVSDGVIEVERTDEEKFMDSIPKGKWLEWNEVRKRSPFGHERSKEIVEELEDVEIEEREKPGPVDDKTKHYKF